MFKAEKIASTSRTSLQQKPLSTKVGDANVQRLPTISGPGTYSPSNILELQRTIGNRAVTRMLRQHTQSKQTQNGLNSAPVIQRKGAMDADYLEVGATKSGIIANSTWSKIVKIYKAYLATDDPKTELKYLRRLKELCKSWKSGKQGSDAKKDGFKNSMLNTFEAMLEEDYSEISARAFAQDLGLPVSLINQIEVATLKKLVEIGSHFEQGNTGQADALLAQIRDSIPGYDLVKSMLIRHYIGDVNPALHQVMENPNYSHQDEQIGAKAHEFNTQATYLYHPLMGKNTFEDYKRSKFRDPVKKQKHDKEQKHMVDDAAINTLSNTELNSVNVYSTEAHKKINPSLRDGIIAADDSPKKLDENKLAYTQTMVSGMNKLPPYKGQVYRHSSLFAGYNEVNQVGATVSDMAFMSTTYLATSLKALFGSDILEIIVSKSGRFIKPLSKAADEDEVLFKPGTRFKVTKRFEAELDPNDDTYRKWPKTLDSAVQSVLNQDPVGNRIKIVVVKEEV